MKRNGTTSAGRTRWRCKNSDCGASKTRSNDTTTKDFDTFLRWLFSKQSHHQMPGQGRTFRRKTQQFWALWPLAPLIDEIFPVVYVDGIHLGRQAVVLIARNDTHVLGWYIARSENSFAWSALLSRIAPPDMVVTDGGSGFAKACRQQWPTTRIQRCVFHIHNNIISKTGRNPVLTPAIELKAIARSLLHVTTPDHADHWIERYIQWETRWARFLDHTSMYASGSMGYTHKRLVEARRILKTLAKAGTMFTYLDETLTHQFGVLPATTNKIEGATNAPLREMLRYHRGMSLTRRIKAIAWHCYYNTPNPMPAAQVLAVMPTDDDIAQAYADAYEHHPETQRTQTGAPERWGQAIDWHNMRHVPGFTTDY